jgi:hypothetical protein
MPLSQTGSHFEEPTNSDSTPPRESKVTTGRVQTDEAEEQEWVEIERPKEVSLPEESGLNGDNMMIAEVDINAKGSWQIVANTTQ